jgi:Raf kinase inhibitor-like YbhB/YbcL family protein
MESFVELKSADFADGGWVPEGFTAEGGSLNPRLQWSDSPPETRELALICEDPDAPFPKPFTHWLVYGISPAAAVIPKGLPPAPELELPVLARQGRNSLGRIGFTGPNPPFWHGSHRYVFRIFALAHETGLPGGAGRAEFFRAIDGKVLAEASLTGLYQKSLSSRIRSLGAWTAAIATLTWALRKARASRPMQ